jgi:hypothetical protein
MMSTSKQNRGKKNRENKTTYNVDRELLNSHKLTGSTTTVVASDVNVRRQNMNIVQRPPKSLFDQIFWTNLSLETILTSSASAITESNIAFGIGSFPDYSSYLQTFDQYCLYSCVISFAYLQENSAVTSSVQNVVVHTAIDYDNITTIGLTALQGFQTYSATQLSPGTSLVRYVKPCIAVSQGGGSSSPALSGVARQWINSSFNAVTHFGLRCILGITNVSTVSLTFNVTGTLGFRNGI